MRDEFSMRLERILDLADFLSKELMDSSLYIFTVGKERIKLDDLSFYMNKNHHLFGKLKFIVRDVMRQEPSNRFSINDIVWCSMFVYHTGKRFADLGYNSIFSSLPVGGFYRNIADRFDELDKLIMRLRSDLGIL